MAKEKLNPRLGSPEWKNWVEALQRIEEARRSGSRGLDLGDLGLTALPEALWQLDQLQVLSLSRNQLTALPDALGQLGQLQELFLWSNQLTTLPEALWQLGQLQELSLWENQLTTLPEALGQLGQLRVLDLGANRLSALPEALWQLGQLQELNLSRNQLTALPDALGQLGQLQELNLSGNQLTTLPEALWQLGQLQELNLFGNQLTALSEALGQLGQLQELNLSGNQLAALPESLRKLADLKALFLHDNPELGLPDKVLGPRWHQISVIKPPKPPAEILDYYFDTLGKKGRALREVKLILVGRGEVGKSSMSDVLQGKKFIKGQERTDGIAITSWPVELPDGEAKLWMWDFGGQEIMHGTHQFFLTHRSLYVVMVDGRHDRQKQDAEYWLKLVRAFGGDSPVLVVMNRQKENPFDMDRQYLADKYGVKLEHFFRTDCERPADINPLREVILAEAARMLANEERFPAKCWDVKTRLEEMKNHGEDYLSEEQYMDVCNAHGVEDPAEQQKLLRRLADLGTVVSFPDDVKLAELSVLNPEWATDGIYRVVTDEPLREERHGQLQCKALRNLLPRDRWPKPKHLQYMLDLMEKFELCFYVGEGNETVLVPELLPDKTPPLADWNAKQCVVFLYQYPVLPHGVLPRFITRTHQLSEGRERWRSGVELADDSAEALIKADYDANKVSVWVRGPHADARRGLLKVVRHHFGSIHARIRELNPNELVALKDHPDVLQSYSDLVKDERRGKTTVAVTINDERLDRPIADFLDCIERPATRREAAERDKSGRTFYLATGAVYHEHEETMSQDDHSIHIGGNVTNSQVGQTLSKCNITIQEQAPGERKDLLEALSGKVKRLLEQLPPEKQDEAPQVAENLAMLVKQATASKPNRPWYDVSAKGLLEASKFVKDFSGNIAGTIGQLGRLIWPDFQLPQ